MQRINPEGDLFPCYTPLVGIPWRIFSELDHIPRSDEARRCGWLREYDPAQHDVIFVSHNWWTRPANVTPGVYDVGAPDILEGPDRNLKHRVICAGTRKLIDGVPAQQGVTRIEGLDEEFPWSIPAIASPFRGGKEVLIWVDWFSIDQDDPQVKLAGVMSLIHYATLSTAMLIPCRDEAVEAAYPEDLPVYGTRGWCRAEYFIFSLTSELAGEGQGASVYAARQLEGAKLFAATRGGELTQYAPPSPVPRSHTLPTPHRRAAPRTTRALPKRATGLPKRATRGFSFSPSHAGLA